MLNIKNFIIILSCFIVVLTGVFCFTSPKMHKPFQFSVIDYIIKIHSDGAVTTTTKQTTMQYADGN